MNYVKIKDCKFEARYGDSNMKYNEINKNGRPLNVGISSSLDPFTINNKNGKKQSMAVFSLQEATMYNKSIERGLVSFHIHSCTLTDIKISNINSVLVFDKNIDNIAVLKFYGMTCIDDITKPAHLYVKIKNGVVNWIDAKQCLY